MIVTIDGPAGAGKSSVARALAQRLGFRLFDTGAMYRAVTLAAMRRHVAWNNTPALAALARDCEIELNDQSVRLDGQDVTQVIRTPELTNLVHYVADNPAVRAEMAVKQRRAVAGQDAVTEGRDQGTVVFPDAACKIYLTATDRERARRRWMELRQGGSDVSLEEVLATQQLRDQRDRQREVGRLRPADDAIQVDTDGLTERQVVDRLVQLVRRKREHA